MGNNQSFDFFAQHWALWDASPFFFFFCCSSFQHCEMHLPIEIAQTQNYRNFEFLICWELQIFVVNNAHWPTDIIHTFSYHLVTHWYAPHTEPVDQLQFALSKYTNIILVCKKLFWPKSIREEGFFVIVFLRFFGRGNEPF